MSEATHYWPLSGEVGTYTLCRPQLKDESGWQLCGDGFWRHPRNLDFAYSTEQIKSHGYLGVRREPAILTPTPKTITPDPDDGNAMVAQQALDEWRACKQQPKAADWAYRWAVDLCERLGAR